MVSRKMKDASRSLTPSFMTCDDLLTLCPGCKHDMSSQTLGKNDNDYGHVWHLYVGTDILLITITNELAYHASHGTGEHVGGFTSTCWLANAFMICPSLNINHM